MSRQRNLIATNLILFLIYLTPLVAQTSLPEFSISVAPSVVTVVQGEESSVTVTITCDTASLVSAADCNKRPQFDFYFSQLPAGVQAQVATGRAGANTVAMHASSEASPGAFPIEVTVVADDTRQVQTFTLNVKSAASVAPRPVVAPPPVRQKSTAMRWEHHLVIAKTPEELDFLAKELGQESWELVSVVIRQNRGTNQWVGFFKRAKRELTVAERR
jgi:hypothetical protein